MCCQSGVCALLWCCGGAAARCLGRVLLAVDGGAGCCFRIFLRSSRRRSPWRVVVVKVCDCNQGSSDLANAGQVACQVHRENKNTNTGMCVCLYARIESVRTGANRCEPVRTGANRCEPVRIGANQCEPVRTGANRCKPVRTGANRCGANRCEPVRTGANRCEPVRTGANRCASNTRRARCCNDYDYIYIYTLKLYIESIYIYTYMI